MSEEQLNNLSLNSRAQSAPYIISVGGGKGGIGKSFFSTNLGIALARSYRVTIIDLDLGASNQHTCLGLLKVESTLSDFISGKKEFHSLLEQTRYSNLSLISGFYDDLEITQINKKSTLKLIAAIKSLSTDIVILDLGAGSNQATIDFFLCANQSLIVTTPDPTSIENAYRFLKASFFRKIKSLDTTSGVKNVIEGIMTHRDQFGIKSPSQLIHQVNSESPLCGKILNRELKSMSIGIILNQLRSTFEEKIGLGMASVCHKYFGIDCKYLGGLSYDDAVWQSLRKATPLLTAHPHSKASQQILSIAKNLTGSQQKNAVV